MRAKPTGALVLALSLPGLCAAPERPPIPPAGQEMAALMGITPLLERYHALNGQQSLEALGLRQEISERVLTTSPEVDSAVAEIDAELAEVQEARQFLQARRNSFIFNTSLASVIIGTGLGVIDSTLQFDPKTQNTGNAVGAVSGAVSTVLSILAGVKGGGTWHKGIQPSMLSAFFGQPSGNSAYPDIVWRYLNTVPADIAVHVTWREYLIGEWSKLGRIDLGNSRKAQHHIELLTSGVVRPGKLSIGVLESRSSMLYDVRGHISLMKVGLAEVMRSMRQR